MLQETEVQTISLTPTAAEAVRNIMNEKNLEGYALRVFVAGGGCCSVQFGMALDNKINKNDTTVIADGIKVVIDDSSIQYLRGGKIDFVNDPRHGQGFTVDSPSAKKESGGCGCGNHDAEAGKAEDHTCACGGSCSHN